MRPAVIRRSLAAAAAITLLTIPSAFAETVAADGDFVTAGNQTTIDVGTVAPGADVPWYVYFVVTCSGTNHVDANQSVKLTPTHADRSRGWRLQRRHADVRAAVRLAGGRRGVPGRPRPRTWPARSTSSSPRR